MVKFITKISPLALFYPLTQAREFKSAGFEYFSSYAHMATLQKLEFDFVKHFKVELYSEKRWKKGAGKNKQVLDEDEANEIYEKSMKFLEKIDELHQPRNDTHVQYDSSYNKLIANPINQYKLIDRMIEGWPQAVSEIKEYAPNAEKLYQSMVDRNGGLPGAKDLDGSADALIRLQDTYLLNTKDFASGNVLGSKATTSLSTENCFHIGRQAYIKEDFYHTILWMREAYRKFYEDNDQSHDIVDIMDHLSYSLSQYGLKKLAFQVNLKAFEIIDESPKGNYDEEVVNRILQNKKYYEHNYGENPTFEVNFLEANIPKPSRQYRFDEFETYEDLCRQTNIYDRMPKDQKDKLICKYSTQNNNPRLILKPAKMEYIRMNPDFVFFHDVVSHEETEILKEMAKPKLQRATIQNPRTGNLEFAEYRVSKHAWLGPDSGETVANIFSRVMDLIGLDVRGLASEDLQIGDYLGLGGFRSGHLGI